MDTYPKDARDPRTTASDRRLHPMRWALIILAALAVAAVFVWFVAFEAPPEEQSPVPPEPGPASSVTPPAAD